jgi:plasmid stability protein
MLASCTLTGPVIAEIIYVDAVDDARDYGSGVASLSIRNIDDEIVTLLRVRAARHGVSMEEEARRVLRAAVTAPQQLGDMAVTLFGAANGVELVVPESVPHDPPVFAD